MSKKSNACSQSGQNASLKLNSLAQNTVNRRAFLIGAAGAALLTTTAGRSEAEEAPINLAKVATPSSLYTSGDTKTSALKDGFAPANSADNRHGSYGNWPRVDTQWVQYDWSRPITTNKIDVYWWIDGQGVGAPKSCRVLYWNGSAFVPVHERQRAGSRRKHLQHHHLRRRTDRQTAPGDRLGRQALHRHSGLESVQFGSGSGVPALRGGGHRPHGGSRRQDLPERQGGVAHLQAGERGRAGARSPAPAK